MFCCNVLYKNQPTNQPIALLVCLFINCLFVIPEEFVTPEDNPAFAELHFEIGCKSTEIGLLKEKLTVSQKALEDASEQITALVGPCIESSGSDEEPSNQ